MNSSPTRDTEIVAARLTVAALQELSRPLDTLQAPLWYQLPVSPAPLTSEELISKLSELPKPLLCFGVSIGRGLVVCTYALPPEYRGRMEVLRTLADDIQGDLAAEKQEHLQVKTKLGELLISADQLQFWFARYHLPHLQMSFGAESSESIGSSRTHVLTFRPPTGDSVVEVRE